MSSADNQDNQVTFYIEKSQSTLGDAKLLFANNRFISCVNRLYYACFYIVTAVLIKKVKGKIKSHSTLRLLFNNHFVRTGIVSQEDGAFYSALMEKRGEADYGDFETFTKEETDDLVTRTEAFINTVKKLVV